MQIVDFTIRLDFFSLDGEPHIVDGEAFLERVTEPLLGAFHGAVTPSTSEASAYLDCSFPITLVNEAIEKIVAIMSDLGLGPSAPDHLMLTSTVEMGTLDYIEGRRLAVA